MTARKPRAGEQPLAATATRRIRVKTVPRFPQYTLSAHASLFAADDILALVSTARLCLIADADPTLLALQLDAAFNLSWMWHVPNAKKPAPQDVLDSLATVARLATQLLGILRLTHDHADEDDDTADWFRWVAHGLSGPAPPMFWALISNDDHRKLYSEIARREADTLPNETDAQGPQRAMAAAASRAVLAAVPTALRTLAAAARAAHDQLTDGASHRTGRKRSVLNESLFTSLCRLHVKMFGSKHRQPSVRWARHVMQLATERLGQVMNTDRDFVLAVKNIATLADTRIAALLKEASGQQADGVS